MGMNQAMPVLIFVPVVVLVAISYFVLLVNRRVETQAIKAFGYVTVILLWVIAAIMAGTGISLLTSGSADIYPVSSSMRRQMWKSGRTEMPPMMPPMMQQRMRGQQMQPNQPSQKPPAQQQEQ